MIFKDNKDNAILNSTFTLKVSFYVENRSETLRRGRTAHTQKSPTLGSFLSRKLVGYGTRSALAPAGIRRRFQVARTRQYHAFLRQQFLHVWFSLNVAYRKLGDMLQRETILFLKFTRCDVLLQIEFHISNHAGSMFDYSLPPLVTELNCPGRYCTRPCSVCSCKPCGDSSQL